MQPGTEPGTEKWIRYFDRPGPANTRQTLECCIRRAQELGIKTVVIASLRGASASLAVELFAGSGLEIVAVTIPPGAFWVVDSLTNDLWEDIPEFRRQKEEWVEAGLERIRMDMDEETQSRLEAQGVRVVRGTIPFYGIGTSLSARFKGLNFEQYFTEALRLISGGMIVCVEAAIMAADANIIRTDEEVVVTAGTSMGLDTAVVMRPSTSLTFCDPQAGLEIREIIALPRDKPKYSPEGVGEEYR
jgi:hypothetical protein